MFARNKWILLFRSEEVRLRTIELDLSKKYFVTGGAGFIGSHLVEYLWQMGCPVTVYDNLSTGRKKRLEPCLRAGMTLFEADLNDKDTLARAIAGQDVVFHLAAYADTQRSGLVRNADLENGTVATWNLLEAMYKHGVSEIAFASSQLVYGELDKFPISESAGPLLPTSLYGASKLACEGLISAYAHLFDIRATICRFGNIMGGRMWRGILYDFIHKLIESPGNLEILGDGQQARNYLLIDYCLDAMLLAHTHETGERCRLYNVGNSDTITATEVAQIVIQEMGLEGQTSLSYTGGRHGWRGDVPNMHYDLSLIRQIGWTPEASSSECIRESVRRLLKELTDLSR